MHWQACCDGLVSAASIEERSVLCDSHQLLEAALLALGCQDLIQLVSVQERPIRHAQNACAAKSSHAAIYLSVKLRATTFEWVHQGTFLLILCGIFTWCSMVCEVDKHAVIGP